MKLVAGNNFEKTYEDQTDRAEMAARFAWMAEMEGQQTPDHKRGFNPTLTYNM